jgi:hypothetical protein
MEDGMAKTSYLAAICFVLLSLLVNAQENQKPTEQELPTSSQSVPVRDFLRDPGFEGAIWGGIVGGIIALVGGILAISLAGRAARKDSRRQIVRELQKEFVYGSMLRARLRAELLLFHDLHGKYKGQNFEALYKGAMPLDEYADVAAVLNLFRLLNEYKEAGHIDEVEARAAFGWIYDWWWKNVIKPYSTGLEGNPDWQPHITKRDWLLG